MAQTVNVRLSRSDNTPWGFRLQGGKDFGQPLLIQKVNGGSIAERAGLQVGDALIRVNNVEVADMRHKDAQDTIVRGGNSFEVIVQRGGGATWRPQVSPVGNVPHPGKALPTTTVTKTSLTHNRSPAPGIGSGHNISPKPFGGVPQVNGDPNVKAIVNKQYNTPVQMYSEATIAETLSAQAEVLAGGAIGVNFMKNEKTYDSQKSEVFKMVQEVDKEPREPDAPGTSFAAASRLLPHSTSPRPMTPTTKETGRDSPLAGVNDNPPCSSCGKHIVGVFVRIKDKNLHVECFKCATCGTSLKNVGYYTINNKLYCDIHAKMVARQNPPAANLEPVTVPPGGRAPVGAFTTPQTFAAPQSPQPGTLAPLPFHAPRTTISHVVAPRFGGYKQTTAPSGPKPFGSVPAPSLPTSVPAPFTPSSIAPPASTPFSSVPPPPSAPSSLIKPLSEALTPVVWPPTSQSLSIKSEHQIEEKRLSVCSEEVCKLSSHKLEISDSIVEEERPVSPVPERPLSRQDVGKAVLEAGERVKCRSISPKPPKSPRSASPRPKTPKHLKHDNPELLDISTKPFGIYSLLPPACLVRPLTPTQVVVFPPEIPAVIYSRSPTPRKEKKKSPERCTTCPSPLNALVPYESKEVGHVVKAEVKNEQITCSKTKVCKESKSKEHTASLKKQQHLETHKTVLEKEIKRETSPHKIEEKHESLCEKMKEKMYFTKSEVEQLIHEEVLRALSLKDDSKCVKEEVEQKEVSVHDLPKPIAPSGCMASALATASERPFTPIPFPKRMELPSIANKIIPMEPIELKKDEKPVPLPSETTPYFPRPPPPPGKEDKDDRTARALREVGCRSPMTEALTIAPKRSYSPLPTFSEIKIQEAEMKSASSSNQRSITSALTVAPKVPFTIPGKTPIPSVDEGEKKSAFRPVFNNHKAEKTGIDMKKVAEGGHMKETVKYIESGHMVKSHHEKSEKHLLPTYQENIGEIPVRNRSISPVPHRIVAPTIKPTPAFIPQPPKPKQEAHVSKKESKSESSEKAQYCQTKTVPGRPVTPSGLHAPQELPYYQQNIGVIPIRNKSVSPLPHITKAPQLETQTTMQQGYKSTTYSETKTYSAQQTSAKTLTKNITKTEECSTTGQKPEPTWKVETKKTIQNLSPITVRLPSPRPTTPVKGETAQAAIAKVQIHRPRPSSPLPPKIKVQVEYPTVTTSGPNIGSEKSAFTTVKNGSNHIKTSVEQSSSAEVCKQTPMIVVQEDSECCKKESKAKDVCHTTQSTHTTAVSEQSSVSSEQTSAIQKKTSGVTSFRVYGATSHNTAKNEDYGTSGKTSKSLKMEQGVKSKTFEQQLKTVMKSETGKNYKEASQILSKTTSEQKSVKATEGTNESVREIKYGEIPSSSSNFKSNIPGPKPFTGGSKGLFTPTTCPLPTFPSLPQLSDVPRTPGGGGSAGGRVGTFAGSTAPKRGRGILNPCVAPGARIPLCGHCNSQIRGPFITALGKIWCPEHFVCVNAKCRRPLQDIGFVEERDGLYCEFCFEQYLAPACDKCHSKIKGDCLNAIGKHFHPECFSCAYCGKLFGNNPFFLEDALPYCENDWNELFTTKCFSCGFPIEAGDRWVEALNNNYHSQCFNCTMCKKNLEGQSFFAKAGRPFCKNHAR